jgi:hypothetical protein
MKLRTALALSAWMSCVSCSGSDPSSPADPVGSTTETIDSGAETSGPLQVADLAGQWRGSIGEAYSAGCLCLTLSESGEVIGPSGITLGFPVATAGDQPDVNILDADGRRVSIHMLVSGSGFWIEDAAVNDTSDGMAGDWLGDIPSPFDGTITLDREPATCQERTGLAGAPC